MGFLAKLTPRLTPRRRNAASKGEVVRLDEFTRIAKNTEAVYDVLEQLGEGGFATVKRGRSKADNSSWALKMIPNDTYKKNKENTDLEVEILKKIAAMTPEGHRGLVRFHEVIKTDSHFVIVLELLAGGELFDRIVEKEKYTEEDAKTVVKSMFETLAFLHSNKIVHRDIKPENYIYAGESDDSDLKLTDFGFADQFEVSGQLTASCGTPEYVAPEVIYDETYNEKCDIWSVGVIVYIILCGFPPFYSESGEDDELFEKIQAGDYDFPPDYWGKVSNEAKAFIKRLLVVNPANRYSAAQALEDPWFSAESAADNLDQARENIRRYAAVAKFRKAVFAIVARNRVENMFKAAQKVADRT